MIAKAIALGLVTLTAYRPVPEQTKPECTGRFHCTTATDDGITRYGVAVSQDFLRSGELHYGDVLWLPGFGYRVVNDCMGSTVSRKVPVIQGGYRTIRVEQRRAVDLMVFTRAEEHTVGVRRIQLYKLEAGK